MEVVNITKPGRFPNSEWTPTRSDSCSSHAYGLDLSLLIRLCRCLSCRSTKGGRKPNRVRGVILPNH